MIVDVFVRVCLIDVCVASVVRLVVWMIVDWFICWFSRLFVWCVYLWWVLRALVWSHVGLLVC